MTRGAWLKLLADDLRRGKRRAAMAGIGILAGAAALVYFISLGAGVRETALTKLVKDLPAEEVQLSFPSLDVGPLQIERPSFMGGGKVLDDRIVESVKNFKIDEGGREVAIVKNVWRQLDADFPVSISGNLMGVGYGTDTAVSGVDPGMVEADVTFGSFKYDPAVGDVPCLVPKALLEVYNSAFASAQDLPKLNPSFLFGKHFTMSLGESSVSNARSGEVIQRRGVISGLTERGTLLGVTVPIDYVREWNARLGKSGGKINYRMLTVVAVDPKYVPAIKDYAAGLGLEARSSTGLAERVGAVVILVSAGLSLLALLIVFVAALNAFSIFTLIANEKRREAALLIALGATRFEVRALIVAEACAIGLVAGLGAIIVAWVSGGITNFLFGRLETASLLGDRVMGVTAWAGVAGALVAVCAAVISGWSAARELSKIDPARSLQQ